MCSSSYQRLNSASNSVSMSLHTISNPVPRVLPVPVLLIAVSSSCERRSPGRLRGQGFTLFDRRALAQQSDPDPQSRNGTEGPAGAVAASQAEQQRKGKRPQQRADLAKRQNAAGHRTGAASGCQPGGLG